MIAPRPEIRTLLWERRFTRFLVLSRDLPRTPGACSWCGGPCPRGLKYCSAACRDEANIRASGVEVERLVFARDRGVCAACGMDCHWLRSELDRIRDANKQWCWRDGGSTAHGPLFLGGSWGPWRPACSYGRLWEADHIMPVVLGGGVCGLSNYRTLCLRCHKAESAALARRRAGLRRGMGASLL